MNDSWVARNMHQSQKFFHICLHSYICGHQWVDEHVYRPFGEFPLLKTNIGQMVIQTLVLFFMWLLFYMQMACILSLTAKLKNVLNLLKRVYITFLYHIFVTLNPHLCIICMNKIRLNQTCWTTVCIHQHPSCDFAWSTGNQHRLISISTLATVERMLP